MDLSQFANIQASKDQVATIVTLAGATDLVLRLAELGFSQGQHIRVVGRSLFRSPIYVEIRGAVLALRKSEAQCIQVKI